MMSKGSLGSYQRWRLRDKEGFPEEVTPIESGSNKYGI